MTPENRNTIDDATHDEWLATSRNMKMEISKEWAEKSAKIEGDAAVGAGLPSALGLSKLAAPVSAFPLATGWTAPSAIPPDVARKIIAARDALTRGDTDETWHQLYSIADPRFESVTPWANLEAQSNTEVSGAKRPLD